MRITQQMIVQSGIKLAKTENVDLSSLVGKVLNGKIVSLIGDQMATFSTGEMTLTVGLGDIQLSENQTVALEISEFKDGTLFANVVKDSLPDGKNEKVLELLTKLGVQDTPENRAILETMKISELPMTKAQFTAFKQGMNEIKALASELVKTDVPLLSKQLDEPIKAVVMGLMQNKEVLTQNKVALTPEQELMTIKSDISSHMNDASIHRSDSKLAEVILKAFEGLERTVQTPISVNATPELKEAVIALLKQTDMKQEALVLKNDLPITLKSLFVAYDILDGKGTTARLMTVLDTLDRIQLPQKTMIDLIDVIASPKPQEEKVALISAIISEDLQETESKSTILKELAVIKESVPFSKGLNDQFVVMQMPIQVKDQIERVEIYYKRRKQKNDKDEFVILVALDTHKYGQVRCLIQKKGIDYTLSFSLVDSKAKEAFESNSDMLKEALESISEKRFKMSFAVKNKEVDLWPESSPLETFGFDLKV